MKKTCFKFKISLTSVTLKRNYLTKTIRYITHKILKIHKKIINHLKEQTILRNQIITNHSVSLIVIYYV